MPDWELTNDPGTHLPYDPPLPEPVIWEDADMMAVYNRLSFKWTLDYNMKPALGYVRVYEGAVGRVSGFDWFGGSDEKKG